MFWISSFFGSLFSCLKSLLKPKSLLSESQIVGWMLTADTDLLPQIVSGFLKKPKVDAGARKALMQNLQKLNIYLRDHTYLVGERVSLADISVFAALIPAFEKCGMNENEKKNLPCLTRWYNTILNQPCVMKVVDNLQTR